MQIRPPDFPAGDGYEDLSPWVQANLLAYDQIREIEEFNISKMMAGVK